MTTAPGPAGGGAGPPGPAGGVGRHAAALAALPEAGPRTWPVWLALRALAWFVGLLPDPVVYALGRGLGALVWVVVRAREPRANRKGRGVALNVRRVFGATLDARGQARLVRAYARHLAWTALEALRLRRLTPRRVHALVDTADLDALRRLRDEGRGVIVASGHMGHWEVLAYAAAARGLETVVLARPCPEAGLERFLRELRGRSGLRVLSKFGGLWPLKKALARGAIVGMNVDENARDGVFVPFCGRLAATNQSAALLQRVSRAPIAVMTCQRLRPGRFQVRLWDVIRPEPGPPEAEVLRVTTRVAAGLERALRAHPEQWLWSLRRWETRPPGEASQPPSGGGPTGPPVTTAG